MDAIISTASAPPPPARLMLLADRIHSLGPRPLFYLLSELAAGADPMVRFEAYGRLAPLAGFIAQHHGDHLPGLRVVSGGRR